MTFRLIASARQRWRAVNVARLVALVRAGARFGQGVLAGREQVTVA
jgi:putative transposase